LTRSCKAEGNRPRHWRDQMSQAQFSRRVDELLATGKYTVNEAIAEVAKEEAK